ncbi:septum formation initiator [Saccharomonospora sp. NPDC046836]|uniref:septum formation initiator n=1 Tax=Saccharomonospora sp. NPDC046836 TaxID=3156921 RepID=UPI0033BFD30B
MTAPARTRTQSEPRPRAPRTRQRARAAGTAAPQAPEITGAPRRRSSAAERAYARRAQRVGTLGPSAEPRPAPVKVWLRWPRSRTSFVLLLMSLLAAGVATTLWLSTQAIADSYRLEELRQNNANLAERAEHLQREVATAESPSELAERAKALGMVPGGNPARLVVDGEGSVTVVGEPTRAAAAAPPPKPDPQPGDRDQQQQQREQQQRQPGDGADAQGQDEQQRHGDDAGAQGQEQGTTGGD